MPIKEPAAPNQLICITLISIQTTEGLIPGLIAFDQYSHYCFFAEFARDLNKKSTLDIIRKLMMHEKFQPSKQAGFMLVVDFGEDLLPELNGITAEYVGVVKYHPEYVQKATENDLKEFFKHL